MDKQKDHLEDFVKSNRQEFDSLEPSEKVWKRVSRKLRMNSNSQRWGTWIWRAASIIFFCSTVYFWKVNKPEVQEQLATTTEVEEFDRIESYYFSVISEKQDQIVDYQNKIEVSGSYEVDLQKLDAMYEVLKSELIKNPSNNEVKDALTLNLLVRIDLLNEQLRAIEELRSEQKPQQRGV